MVGVQGSGGGGVGGIAMCLAAPVRPGRKETRLSVSAGYRTAAPESFKLVPLQLAPVCVHHSSNFGILRPDQHYAQVQPARNGMPDL